MLVDDDTLTLSERDRELVSDAVDMFLDSYDGYVEDFLPRQFKYTEDEKAQVWEAAKRVAAKLKAFAEDPEPSPPYLATTAEEMAAWALVGMVEALEDMEWETTGRPKNTDLSEYLKEDGMFEDWDVLMLYDMAYDGIETEAPESMGLANLTRSDWFTPFRN